MRRSPTPTPRQQADSLMSEAAFQTQVLRLATLCGWDLAYHTHNSQHSQAGFPDLTLVRADALVFLELKSERGRITLDQAKWLAALRDVKRIEAALVRPSDYEKVELLLKQF